MRKKKKKTKHKNPTTNPYQDKTTYNTDMKIIIRENTVLVYLAIWLIGHILRQI